MNALLLDDDAFTSGLLAAALRECGCARIWLAGSGEAAALLLAQAPPERVDLVFCDPHLPALGGVGFLRGLPATRFAGDVVLLGDDSARTLQLTQAMLQGSPARLLGALRKPTDKAALRALLADRARRPVGAT